MRFGQQVLSHPLLVPAIEGHFAPAVVYNNPKGRPGDDVDAKRLARFEEPRWNNPVVRFLDAKGADLIPRQDGVYRPAQIARRMVLALEAARRPVPEYLRLAALETEPRYLHKATFAMF